HAHYHMVEDVRYIRERIEADMFGVFLNGEIAGFVGTHEERSMGLLKILPEYRRLGLAYALEARLINHLLSQGRVPFCQVAIVNNASIRLQQKLGLVLSDHVVYWLGYHRETNGF
ncbi:MAG: GNAT family N-acetyltransferase, partial [Eubacteriales bacterium]|nr:GNAT family N-acetyltransferase [Eubacteriales bacterium]